MHLASERRGRVGEAPLILGYAGLLPQTAALATCFFESADKIGAMFAFGYGVLILSFVGGIWWGFAMRAHEGASSSPSQGAVASAAVTPSLLATLLILLAVVRMIPLAWALVLLGSAIITTLLFDRKLAQAGLTPEHWMEMRIPLSIGLGLLTILCGVVL
ncbi:MULTISPECIES: DUF3429 domain-containing protein [unclassified Sphingomonas]|jgi:hypothetical protein|uniref:DUF3429 domain-containing protein n=1 Tax=unclassified Sphingomonas TaxID=196159 RepID=UPI002269F934|nr:MULTISPECIES: DUF3429 domain-containing protein [unclassified Sphingomonas]